MRLREVVYGLTVAIMTVFLVGCEQEFNEPMDKVPSSIDDFTIALDKNILKGDGSLIINNKRERKSPCINEYLCENSESATNSISTNNNLIHTVAMPSQLVFSDGDVQHAAIITVKFLNNLLKNNADFKLKVTKGRNSQFTLAALYKKQVKKTWKCKVGGQKKIDVTCSS